MTAFTKPSVSPLFALLFLLGAFCAADLCLLANTSIFYLQLDGPLKNETITDLYRSFNNACWLTRYTHGVDHIFIGWVCDNTSWLARQPEEINQHIQIFRHPRPQFGNVGLLLTGFAVPLWAVFLFSRLLASANKRTKLNYFALLILTLLGTILARITCLVHFIAPSTIQRSFYELWNVAYQLPLGPPMKWRLLPSTNHLLMSFFDVSKYQRSHSTRL